MSPQIAAAWTARLVQLGKEVALAVRAAQLRHEGGSNALAVAVREADGDRIYALDELVEEVIRRTISGWPAEALPLRLVAEGFPPNTQFGGSDRPARYCLLLDPIDGTRMLMFRKRSAWFLAALAEDRGAETSLADSLVSIMFELPLLKCDSADAFVAVRGQPTQGISVALDELAQQSENALSDRGIVRVAPSSKTDLRDSFITVVSYFPGAKALAAELTERIAQLVPQTSDVPNIFEDQCLSTGGQLVQLLSGQDLCCIDLRPLFQQMPEASGRVMSAHPYDLAGLLCAEQSGVIVTDGFGRRLSTVFDTHTPVHWCGYANAAVQQLIEPVVQDWLAERLGE